MPELPVEAEKALEIVREVFADRLVAVWLHGSAVAGGLRPDSDVDVLVVVDGATTRQIRGRFLRELTKISGHPGRNDALRPLELIVFRRRDLDGSTWPPRCEFLYGEWLRESFEAGKVPEPHSDPDFALLLAQVRQNGSSLAGPDPGELLPVIGEAEIRRATGEALPALIASLEGDERNVLLTLARMWRTLATGEFVPKDVAARWAAARLPDRAAAIVADAREAYLSGGKDARQARRQEIRRAAGELARRVTAML